MRNLVTKSKLFKYPINVTKKVSSVPDKNEAKLGMNLCCTALLSPIPVVKQPFEASLELTALNAGRPWVQPSLS